MSSHQHPIDEIHAQAASYALGSLDGEELRSFEQHLQEGCSVCQTELDRFMSVAAQLGGGVQAVQPRASLREKLLTRIKQESSQNEDVSLPTTQSREKQSGLTYVRAVEGAWQEIQPGVTAKILYVDSVQGRITALGRMTAGSSYTPHRHASPEEFYVLEGSCVIGGQLLHVGDYHRAEAGSIHTSTYTDEGCLMFVIFSPNNEPLETVES